MYGELIEILEKLEEIANQLKMTIDVLECQKGCCCQSPCLKSDSLALPRELIQFIGESSSESEEE